MTRLAVSLIAAFGLLASVASAGTVEGHVRIGVEGVDLSSVAPIVVFLEAEGDAPPVRSEAPAITITQENARFEPGFAVVEVGQRVSMPNFDGFFHNVFSFSRPNDFDLGVYASGEERSITFDHPGLVRLYCSIHESMSGLLLIVPSRSWSLAGADGAFSIPRVPPGRYDVIAWSEQLPPTRASIVVGTGSPPPVDLVLGVSQP